MKIPYECQIFVCVNDRKGQAKSCADGGSPELRTKLKDEVKKRWPAGEVRVSQSLCMGLCSHGPNIAVYPFNVWYSAVTLNDIEKILADVDLLLKNGSLS